MVAWTLFQTLQHYLHSYQVIQLFCFIYARTYYPINRAMPKWALLQRCLNHIQKEVISCFFLLVFDHGIQPNDEHVTFLTPIGLCVKVTCVTKPILSAKLKVAVEMRIVRINQRFVMWATAFLSSVQRAVVLRSHRFWHKASWTMTGKLWFLKIIPFTLAYTSRTFWGFFCQRRTKIGKRYDQLFINKIMFSVRFVYLIKELQTRWVCTKLLGRCRIKYIRTKQSVHKKWANQEYKLCRLVCLWQRKECVCWLHIYSSTVRGFKMFLMFWISRWTKTIKP